MTEMSENNIVVLINGILAFVGACVSGLIIGIIWKKIYKTTSKRNKELEFDRQQYEIRMHYVELGKLLIYGNLKNDYVESMVYLYRKYNEFDQNGDKLSNAFKACSASIDPSDIELFSCWNSHREKVTSYINVLKNVNYNHRLFGLPEDEFESKMDKFNTIVKPLNRALYRNTLTYEKESQTEFNEPSKLNICF
eukprot:NODE_934_length_2956_cov_0.140357.p2 type:complete len:194 gc:universal NODE_934_length_2956_cov_0.140357:2137-1556(-)